MQQQRMLVAKALTKSRSQSQGVVSKNKHQDLRDSSTSQLDDDDLFENDNHAVDFNKRHKLIAELFLWVEEIMA